MKKIILLLLIFTSYIQYAQAGLGVEMRLVNPDYITDEELDNILQSHQVYSVDMKLGYPIYEQEMKIFQLSGAINLENLRNDLLAYSEVVENAFIVDASLFPDAGMLQILHSDIGIPVGFENNIVLTNDTGLNEIFETFNVYYYEQAFPNSTWESTLRVYNVVCDCDVQQLLDVLNEYTDVIEHVSDISAIYLLGIDEYEFPDIKIYPNPFSSQLMIESSKDILHYNISDLTGKNIINTRDVNELQNHLLGLSSGVYIIRFQTNDATEQVKKIIKK